MAYADYRLCDVCGGKTFYDANLNYDRGADVEGSVRNSGVLLQHTRLDYLGDWCVICQECAETHECRVVKKDGHATAQAGLHGEAEAEALLRQALEVLETVVEHFDPYMGDNECRPMENARYTIAAMRERLGEKS